jgi:hypothetical protein
MFPALSQRFTYSIRRGVVWFAQVAKADSETAVGTFLSKLFPSCLKRCGGMQPRSSITMHWGRPLDVRFNDRCHTFTPQQPKEARQCQCNRTACEWLIGTPCMGLLVLTHVVVETHSMAKIRFDRV